MGFKVAIVGATGNVGREMLNILEERGFPADEVVALASRRSLNTEVSYGDKTLKTKVLDTYDFSDVDICLMSAGGSVSKEWSPKIGAQGCVVIDNSSAWRYDADVPLMIRAICQELSTTSRCQIEARPWDELLPALRNNETDALVAGLMPDREKRVTLSFTRAYFSLPARFVAVKTEQSSPASFSPDGKNVGVLADTAHEALLKTYFPKAKITPYNNSELLYKGLQDGKVQLIFGDAMSLSLRMNPASASDNSNGACCHFVGGAYPATEFLGQGMAIALRKQDADLRLAFNNALTALERKGVLDDLYLRYFPVGFY